jgi:carboxypeptidase family protein
MSFPIRIYFVLFVMHLAAVLAWPAPIGSIKGYVRDPSGAPVPNAILSLTNERTGVVQKTVSDGAGLYQSWLTKLSRWMSG